MIPVKHIACVGAGQLALMLGQAANDLSITLRSAGVENSCSFSKCESYTKPLDNNNNIDEFLDDIDVFTFESEHEGLEISDYITKKGIPIRPSASFVKIAGDRLLEKNMLSSCSIPVAPYKEIPTDLTTDDLMTMMGATINDSPHGIVIKTRRGGYDGKGQWVIKKNPSEQHLEAVADEIVEHIENPGCIVEHLIDFSIECSILASRSIDGEIKTWPLTHNIHEDSILRRSESPMVNIANYNELEKQAISIANILCESNDYIGTIAVECFVTQDGLVVNEIAPRVHNSGHWTIEGSNTSQFEQHIRSISGLPLGDTKCDVHSIMLNIIGTNIDVDSLSKIDNVFVHLYGKEVREKRKVGHITIIGDSELQCRNTEAIVLSILNK